MRYVFWFNYFLQEIYLVMPHSAIDLNDVRFRGPWPVSRISLYKKEFLAWGYCTWHQYKRIRAIHRIIVASDNHILDNSGYVHMEWFFGQFGNQPDTKCKLIGEIEPYLINNDQSGVELFTLYWIGYAPYLFLFGNGNLASSQREW